MEEELKARLHPHWVGGEAGYVYSVICGGKILVERSRDPECDAARALVVQGIIGNYAMARRGSHAPLSTLKGLPS